MSACCASAGTVTNTPSSRTSLVPGLDAGKPLRRRRIGGPAQKSDHQHKVGGLAVGQVGMNPEPVARQQVGRLGDGQCDVAALDVNIHLGSGKVEGRAARRAVRMKPGSRSKQQQQATAHVFYCTNSSGIGERAADASFC